MVETSKQVRVDNWGIYFLQRLQLFFSKTDYCDLTLQFEGNVQLKVHRLVMNACTEYFSFLEQTCPALEESTIMMPSDLQADVIVPIVNFMYTGMLEFHPSIFDKLYKAADTMNIAVLTKLLEAQLHRFKNKSTKKETPSNWTPVKKPQKPAPVVNDVASPLPSKKLPIWRKRQPTQHTSHTGSGTAFPSTKWNSDRSERDPLTIVDNTPKPTRFEWPDDDQPPFSLDPSFDDVSLTSKPLWTKADDPKATPSFEEAHSQIQKPRQPASKNNSISSSQDIIDEYLQKEQKVNVEQLDESTSLPAENPLKRKGDNKTTTSPKRVKITNQDEETIISIKASNPSELDHTKIVSEILKKYPDLVKKKKNIKLKITSSKNETPQIKIQTATEKAKPQAVTPVEKPQPSPVRKGIRPDQPKQPAYNNTCNKKTKAEFRAASDEGPWTCMECLGDGEAPEFVLYYLFRKHMSDVHQVEFKNFFCKYCGKKCPTDHTMAYHLYTKHGLRPASTIKFPQCTTCPFIGLTTDTLQEHINRHGKNEVQCVNCKLGFFTQKDLLNHQQITGHHNRSALSILDCPYCSKKHQAPLSLFTHIRTQHLKEGRRDGITSLEETMDVQNETETESVENSIEEMAAAPPEKDAEIVINRIEKQQQQTLKEKVNIISNVKVATRPEESSSETTETVAATVVQEPAVSEPEPVAVTTTAAALSNMGGSLATNLGLVDIVVLDDNQQYILQQPQGQAGNAEFMLPELTGNEGILQAATAAADLSSTDELVMVLTDHDYQDEQSQGQSDNSNIVVLYSHPVEGQQGQFITSQGNILVNSQGLLEIHNGTSVTTTAGQILVNSDSTTTTQAIESPIESIELIRKEIEGGVVEQDDKGNIKAVLRKKVLEKEINKIEKDVIPVKETNQIVQDRTESNLENGNGLLDTTDSSIQEEPMEVDEIGPQQTENLQESHGEEEKQSLNSSAENQEADPVSDQGNEEEAGHDVPPDFPKETEKTHEIEVSSTLKMDTGAEHVILNDPNEHHENLEHETVDIHKTAEDELMEVDGGKVPDEQIEEEEEVDHHEVPSTQDQTEDTSEHQEQDDLEHDPLEVVKEQESTAQVPSENIETNQDESAASNQEPSVENDQIHSMENDQEQDTENLESSIENDQQPCSDSCEESGVVLEQELSIHEQEPSIHDQEPVSENDQVSNMENDQGASAGNDRNIDNDQNDNVQPNFDDFTDESQQSSSQKVSRDLNKEILDDWDDTDSQQSHSQEQDNQEEVQDQAAMNAAAENVNKLMDDWDEEDEDQSKE